MPLKHKHSEVSGRRANLTPGEIGHVRPDDVLLIRGEDRKLAIDLYDWRHRSVPPGGQPGAPLSRDAFGELVWDATQLPEGQVGGGFYTDGGPGPGWSVPGWTSAVTYSNYYPGSINNTDLNGKTAHVEEFYVASDTIIVTAMGTRFVWPDSNRPAMRMGLLNSDNVVLVERRNNAPPNLWTETFPPIALQRGYYKLMVYNDGPYSAPIIDLSGLVANQGFTFDLNTFQMRFLGRQVVTGVDMLGGLYLGNGAVPQDMYGGPGVAKSVFLRYLLPLPAGALLGASASPTSLSAERVGAGVATTPTTTISPQGGSGFATYSWLTPGFTVSDPTGQTVSFSKELGAPDSYSNKATCTVTDILSGEETLAEINVSFVSTTPPSGGGGGGSFPLNVSVSPPGGTIYASPGELVTICHDVIIGGDGTLGPYEVSWNGDGSGCCSAQAAPQPGGYADMSVAVSVWSTGPINAVGSAGASWRIVTVG